MERERNVDETVMDLRSAYERAEISREEYWRAMQRHHADVVAYRDLFAGGEVSAITVDRDGGWVVLDNGLRLRWNPADTRTAPNMLLNHGSYEPEETAALLALAADAQCVLDIGANQGWYSVHLARVLRSGGGRLYAFEPVPTTFEVLVENVRANGYEDVVRCLNFGLAESAGSFELFLPRFTGSVGASRTPLFPDDENTRVQCELRVLDDVVQAEGLDGIELIKCDVEGSELMVLKGARRTLARQRPVVMLEMLRKWAQAFGYHPNDIVSFMSELDYECWGLDGNGLVATPQVTDETRATNFFFFPRSAPERRERLIAALEGARD